MRVRRLATEDGLKPVGGVPITARARTSPRRGGRAEPDTTSSSFVRQQLFQPLSAFTE